MTKIDIEQLDSLFGTMRSDDLSFSDSHHTSYRNKKRAIRASSVFSILLLIIGLVLLLKNKQNSK